MKIIFLTGLFPDNLEKQIQADSKKTIQYAANTLQWNYVQGFDYYSSLTLINLPYVGSFPFLYKKLFLPTIPFQHIPGASDISLGFLNLPLIKNIHRYVKAKKQLIKSLKSETENEIVVIGYALTSPFAMAIAHAKKKYPHIKTCLIVPDLPQYMSDSKNIFYLLLKKTDSFFIKKSLRNIDSLVLLSKHMADHFGYLRKPWVVVEAIYNKKDAPNMDNIKKEYHIVFYSGTLARRYGILNLLQAFQQIGNANYKLWICGEGDSKTDIVKAAQIDNRIKYWGQIPREKVLELQSQSAVLVNPRTSEGEYTKYSFPSKTVEYMASGTPCILYELEGIPKDYLDYCYAVKEETVDALRDKIIEVCNLDEATRSSFAQKAREFILQNKNPQAQCKKVIDMLEKI